MLLAANLADDADTVAAVTGQLAGALYGLNAIPDHWRERVAWKDRLWQRRGGCCRNPLPTGRSWVGSRSTALDPVANTDSKLLILWSVSKGRVLAQDGNKEIRLDLHCEWIDVGTSKLWEVENLGS